MLDAAFGQLDSLVFCLGKLDLVWFFWIWRFFFWKLDLVWFFWICCSFDQQYKDTLPHVFTQEQNNPFIGVQ
jgi:hypothetical protein